ncbi:SDR family NAD(P)-dependent oxidoreductase [Natronorubrum daqingense]|uniref:3-oxoacyl-[acyl-carrier protein] reductase n=1 Tax=Natronorubrum daqingense TaxID=588898 RepID=A0A1N7ETJ1_9EURY|nr:SDR family NAD(P)-dependent oxidoreductase [Natronorubrum daqingense]APX97726.1 short-chain dehydrogenase [Natronorubrum daqingense]SIR91349.1 3-oxoacyl-[acyl-carrier protein] reductase [Natronorubrum daqingense]
MPAALVTGASRGIGRGIARRFAADGYDVAVNYRSSDAAAQNVVDTIETETDQRARAIQADVGDPDAVESCVEETVDAFGSLDHVVNNAGINEHQYTPELSPEEFQRLLDVNVTGTFAVTKAALPYLEDSSVDEGPSVINLSSRLAHAGADYEPHYASSKAGIIALTKSHALEFGPTIRVNAIAPGFIETDMTDATTSEESKAQKRQEVIPVGRLGTPEDIGQAAAYLRDAGFVTGETLNVNGGQRMQ